jgi:hypothetical protein
LFFLRAVRSTNELDPKTRAFKLYELVVQRTAASERRPTWLRDFETIAVSIISEVMEAADAFAKEAREEGTAPKLTVQRANGTEVLHIGTIPALLRATRLQVRPSATVVSTLDAIATAIDEKYTKFSTARECYKTTLESCRKQLEWFGGTVEAGVNKQRVISGCAESAFAKADMPPGGYDVWAWIKTLTWDTLWNNDRIKYAKSINLRPPLSKCTALGAGNTDAVAEWHSPCSSYTQKAHPGWFETSDRRATVVRYAMQEACALQLGNLITGVVIHRWWMANRVLLELRGDYTTKHWTAPRLYDEHTDYELLVFHFTTAILPATARHLMLVAADEAKSGFAGEPAAAPEQQPDKGVAKVLEPMILDHSDYWRVYEITMTLRNFITQAGGARYIDEKGVERRLWEKDAITAMSQIKYDYEASGNVMKSRTKNGVVIGAQMEQLGHEIPFSEATCVKYLKSRVRRDAWARFLGAYAEYGSRPFAYLVDKEHKDPVANSRMPFAPARVITEFLCAGTGIDTRVFSPVRTASRRLAMSSVVGATDDLQRTSQLPATALTAKYAAAPDKPAKLDPRVSDAVASVYGSEIRGLGDGQIFQNFFDGKVTNDGVSAGLYAVSAQALTELRKRLKKERLSESTWTLSNVMLAARIALTGAFLDKVNLRAIL